MSYTINKTNGSVFAVVNDGTINNNSSVTLVGKNYAGYGAFLDENFFHLMENFACPQGTGGVPSAIGNPQTGQLWWDTTANVMKAYNGTTWKTISAATASSSAPSSNVTGDLWWNTNALQLSVYNGAGWTLVGPASSNVTGNSGALVTSVTDSLSTNHVCIFLQIQDEVVATVSKANTYTPGGAGVTGFTTISPGIQLSSTISNAMAFTGNATNSDQLGGVVASNYLRSDINDVASGTIQISNNGALTSAGGALRVGTNNDFNIAVSNPDVYLTNGDTNGNIIIRTSPGGTAANAAVISGTTGYMGINGLTNLNSNGVGNLGSSSSYFNTVFATATTALYADVAERFAADETLSPGTVVELGGVAEITKSIEELSENVFGVVSTRAAFLMNGGAGEDATHPPIAMTGRVPVRVTGTIRKGDRLVSAGNGLARAALRGEATAFNVIGRSLEDKTSVEEGMVEAIVTIK